MGREAFSVKELSGCLSVETLSRGEVFPGENFTNLFVRGGRGGAWSTSISFLSAEDVEGRGELLSYPRRTWSTSISFLSAEDAEGRGELLSYPRRTWSTSISFLSAEDAEGRGELLSYPRRTWSTSISFLSAEDAEGRGEQLSYPRRTWSTSTSFLSAEERGKRGLWTLSDKALAFELAVAAEVEEEADSEAGGFEIVEELGVFAAGELVERFQLDDDLTETQEVGGVVLFGGLSFVC